MSNEEAKQEAIKKFPETIKEVQDYERVYGPPDEIPKGMSDEIWNNIRKRLDNKAMTNQQAKIEAIKKAFGKSWNILSYSMQEHILNVHHWVDRSHNRMNKSPNNLNFDEISECEVHCEFWRPIQLKGIEENNGWIRIEPDGSNLPTDDIDYKFFRKDGTYGTANLGGIKALFYGGATTHYKPIKPELKPVY